ncbi:MAG TPA: YceI family protein [Chloroflexota bacterium]|nr:YceI family protein [Chloroflexota bacterium]
MMSKAHPKTVLAVASAGLMLIGAACGRPSLTPITKLGQTPMAQPPQSTAQPAASATPVANASPAQSAVPASSAGEVTITFNSSDSSAQYQTQEQLAGKNLPSTAVGTTTGISGSIVLTSAGQLDASASKITVNLASLKSDQSMRDSFIQRNTLQTSQYPNAVFVPTAINGLPSSLPASGPATFQLSGNLTVHGVTKPVTWTVTAQFNGQQVSGKATAPFTITEFGMSIPKAGPVLSVQDAGTLELDFSNAPLSA